MTFRTLALLTAAMFFGQVSTARAQAVQIAMCMEGGCSCHVPGTTLEDVALILGQPNPPGAADMTLVVFEDTYSWRADTPGQIDASFGGPGSCLVQLEPPLIPEDGTWRISTGTTDVSECPLFALTGQAIPGQISGETREIAWGGWFRPSRLMAQAGASVNWKSTGPWSWRAVLVDESMSDGTGQTGASVVWDLQLVSTTEITGTSVFDYDISSSAADGAAQAVLQNMQCRTVTPFTAKKVD